MIITIEIDDKYNGYELSDKETERINNYVTNIFKRKTNDLRLTSFFKLTLTDIKEINDLYNKGYGMRILGEMYKVHPMTIQRVIVNPRKPKGGRLKSLSMNDEMKIKELRSGGMSVKELSEMFNLSRGTISEISNRMKERLKQSGGL